jgi:hypothetical protein
MLALDPLKRYFDNHRSLFDGRKARRVVAEITFFNLGAFQ